MLGTGHFIDAVARRALGAIGRDHALLHEAADAFTRMHLPGHVEHTIALAGQAPAIRRPLPQPPAERPGIDSVVHGFGLDEDDLAGDRRRRCGRAAGRARYPPE
jgi:hypothetical protein